MLKSPLLWATALVLTSTALPAQAGLFGFLFGSLGGTDTHTGGTAGAAPQFGLPLAAVALGAGCLVGVRALRRRARD